ncbi:MAG: exodeoxyribonuclease VII large subunit [Clostridiales bacterium]|nr:exodeoxyribonuclease VII large subunit [Clostridiales bacterium]
MQKTLSVYELNKYLKDLIANDLMLSGLYVRGEISNFKNHISGHLYFTLKDEKSTIKCVMFKSSAMTLKFAPKDGMKVIVRGYVSVFERDGQYQLYSEDMQPDGLGSLHLAFEQLKARLQQEGLFDPSNKKKIPYMPSSIGVITAPKGAVIRDILNILGRRFHNVNIKVYPVQVQGAPAAAQISAAIRKLNQWGKIDVIILARGGGSLEDLWPFNEEIVARSIYDSKIPIISAVGHETDFTIADFVADLRAPTPSAAAELVMPDKSALKDKIRSLDNRLRNAALRKVTLERQTCKRLTESSAFRRPLESINQERLRLDVQGKYLQSALDSDMKSKMNRLGLLAASLDALSPLKSLARGYGIVKSKMRGTLVKSVGDVISGEKLEITVSDGAISCTAD